MMSLKEIAHYFHNKGEEVTPDEIRQTLASIASKFRAIDPTLPDNDDELLRIVVEMIRYEN